MDVPPEDRYFEFFSLVSSRRQTYEFDKRVVRGSDVQKILDAARWAPSCSNSQPWRFVIIRNKKTIHNIAMFALEHVFSPFITPLPPLLLAFVLDRKCLQKKGNLCALPQHHEMVDDSYLCVAMCVQNALLAATSLGINTCILTPKRHELKRILHLSDPVILLVGLGYEIEDHFYRTRTRKKLSQLITKRM